MPKAELPFVPRGLSRDLAATYIGISTTKFDELVADGRMPKPKRIDGRKVWDRIEIDMRFADLPAENVDGEWAALKAL